MPRNGKQQQSEALAKSNDAFGEGLLGEQHPLAADDLSLADLLRPEAIQEVQRSFHASTGYTLNIMGRSGHPICTPPAIPPACQIVRCGTDQGGLRCLSCILRLTLDSIRNRHVAMTKCHAGFLCAAAPITAQGRALGAIIVGPALDPAPKKDLILDFARQNSLSPKSYWGAVKRLNVTDLKTIESLARLMRFTVEQMAENAWAAMGDGLQSSRSSRADQASAASFLGFERLFHSALEGIALLVDSLFVEVNPCLSRMLGFENPAELLGRDIRDFIPPVQKDGSESLKLVAYIKETVRGGKPLRLTMRAMRKDGFVFDVESTLVLQGTDSKSPVLLICRDVSEYTAALDESASQKNTLQAIFDGMGEAAVLLDRQGKVLMANKALALRLNSTIEAIQGTSLQDHMDHTQADEYLRAVQSVFKTGLPLSFKDDWKGRTIDYRLNPIKANGDDTVQAVTCLGVDITDSIRKEAELRKLTTAVQQARTGVMIQNSQGLTEYVNPHLVKITGFPSEEILGRHPLDFVAQPDKDALVTAMRDRFEQGRTWRGELCIKRKQGDICWLNAVISPVIDVDGALSHYVSLLEDSTEQKLMDDMLWNSLAEFDAIFNNTAAAIMHLKHGVLSKVNSSFSDLFGYTRREVRKRPVSFLFPTLQDHDEFDARYGPRLRAGEVVKVEQPLRRKDGSVFWCALSGKAVLPSSLKHGIIWIADDITERRELETLREDVERILRHDLKSPLNAVINLPRIVAEDAGISQDSKEMLSMIEEMGYHMLRQVNLSLEIFKIETGTFRLMPEPVDLCQVMQRLAREFALRAMQRKTALDIQIQGKTLAQTEPFMVLGEETFCHTVFANLLENALDASPYDSVITVRLTSGHMGEVTVHNQGMVPEGIRETFFDKYVTRGKHAGTGLGTYSARLLTRAMGGDISMRTSGFAGTTLTVRLPLLTSSRSS